MIVFERAMGYTDRKSYVLAEGFFDDRFDVNEYVGIAMVRETTRADACDCVQLGLSSLLDVGI